MSCLMLGVPEAVLCKLLEDRVWAPRDSEPRSQHTLSIPQALGAHLMNEWRLSLARRRRLECLSCIRRWARHRLSANS